MLQELQSGDMMSTDGRTSDRTGARTDDRELETIVAQALWFAPERLAQRIEAETPGPIQTGTPSSTPAITPPSTEYLARLRHVLDRLQGEQIAFTRGPQEFDQDARMPQAWWDATGRLSWLLWLGRRRQFLRTHEVFERIEWDYDAPAYRAYVRHVVRGLRAQGIHLQ